MHWIFFIETLKLRPTILRLLSLAVISYVDNEFTPVQCTQKLGIVQTLAATARGGSAFMVLSSNVKAHGPLSRCKMLSLRLGLCYPGL